MTGNTDRPIDKIGDDLMNVSNYINGLSTFICTCDTPMTVAIQGDWGSGKTSFMNMTHECIAEKVECIWFNTWQFSQFSMGDNLPIILLKSLAQSIDVDQSNKNIKAKIGILSKMVLDAGSAVVSNYIGVNLKEQYESAISPTEEDVVQVIVGLKKTFEECVHNCLTQKKRINLLSLLMI